MFCSECGRNINEHRICPYCRTPQGIPVPQDFIDFTVQKNPAYSKCSRITAGILQIFLGCFGLGRFYLGYKKIAVIQLALSIPSLGTIGFVWGIIDGMMILSGREKYDGCGKMLI